MELFGGQGECQGYAQVDNNVQVPTEIGRQHPGIRPKKPHLAQTVLKRWLLVFDFGIYLTAG
eukprot:351172-Rhodomonas_salina.3